MFPINLDMSLSYQQRYKNATLEMANTLFSSLLRHLHSYLAICCDLVKMAEFYVSITKVSFSNLEGFLTPFLPNFLGYLHYAALHYIMDYNFIFS